MRYEALIIGAGPDGLAAAALLAGRGLSVLVVERATEPGGPCQTRAFHPGFLASTFADELPPIPPEIFRALDLARRGAVFTQSENPPAPADAIRTAVIQRVMEDAARPQSRSFAFWQRSHEPPFPGEELAGLPRQAQLFDPALASTGLSALCRAESGMVRGGLGVLGMALAQAAEAAGAAFSLGLEATDIRLKRGRVCAIGMADGREVEAKAVISTLDLKRTFLTLFAWNEIAKPLAERIAAFRPAPGIARLLVALNRFPPTADGAKLRRPIMLASDADRAFTEWKSAIVPERPPALVRCVSACDPFLAPDGAATVTVTLAGIPHAPFDGPWTHEKRQKLETIALDLLEEALPGAVPSVLHTELIVPPDIENLIGLTDGDLMGGELSPAQMLGFRPFTECRGGRTPVPGLYLAGPSSTLGPVATCASGWAAAKAVLADRKGAA